MGRKGCGGQEGVGLVVGVDEQLVACCYSYLPIGSNCLYGV